MTRERVRRLERAVDYLRWVSVAFWLLTAAVLNSNSDSNAARVFAFLALLIYLLAVLIEKEIPAYSLCSSEHEDSE